MNIFIGFFAWAAATTVLLIIILIKRLIIYCIQDPAQQQQQPAQQQQQPAQQQQQPAQQPAEFVHTAASTPSTSNFSTPSSVEPLITSNIADRTRSKSGIKKKLFKAKQKCHDVSVSISVKKKTNFKFEMPVEKKIFLKCVIVHYFPHVICVIIHHFSNVIVVNVDL